jgi:predicted enzyme related to lactoylglutathione lyase
MPKITSTMFVIAVNDLMISAAFYEEAMGFEVHEVGDDGWRIFAKDQCKIMAGHCPDAVSANDTGDHSYFAYINVEDVDEYYAEVSKVIERLGGEILKTPRDEPWGMREFALRTNDGHRIMIGHEFGR